MECSGGGAEVSDLRVALVGYGMAGRDIHAPLVRAVDGIRVSHVTTSDPSRAAAAVEENPGVVVLPGLDDLLARAGEVDLVVLASPTGAHAVQAGRVIACDLPLVVDKPMTVTAAQARSVAALARDREVPLAVFQNRRWDPEHRTARAVLDSGVLGDIVRYEARYERWRPVPKDRWREHSSSDEGGGILMDLQSHLVDGALDLFGPVVSVYAELAAHTTLGDDVAFLALRHSSGVTSHLSTTSLAGAPGPRTRLLGRAGAYLVAGVDGDPTPYAAWVDRDDEHRGWLVRGDEAEPVRRAAGAWTDFYVGMRDALVTGSPLPVTAGEGVAVVEVLDAARRSAAENAVISL